MSYEKIGTEIGKLVDTKNAAYGNSFGQSGEIMRILYPSGIKPEQMDDALAVVRVLDKLFRIATDRDALGESPWRDVAGYGLLGAVRVERARGGVTSSQTDPDACGAMFRPTYAPPTSCVKPYMHDGQIHENAAGMKFTVEP